MTQLEYIQSDCNQYDAIGFIQSDCNQYKW